MSFKYRLYYGEYTDDITDSGLANPLPVLRATELTYTIVDNEYFFIDLSDFQAASGYRWFCYPAILGRNFIFYDIATDIAIVFDEPLELTINNEYGLALQYLCYRTTNEIFNEFTMRVKNG